MCVWDTEGCDADIRRLPRAGGRWFCHDDEDQGTEKHNPSSEFGCTIYSVRALMLSHRTHKAQGKRYDP